MTQVAIGHSYFKNSLTVAQLKLIIRLLSKWTLASVCLTLGLRLLLTPCPILITLDGIALLIRVPTYYYRGWCDYRALQEARVVVTFERYLEDCGRSLVAQRAA